MFVRYCLYFEENIRSYLLLMSIIKLEFYLERDVGNLERREEYVNMEYFKF